MIGELPRANHVIKSALGTELTGCFGQRAIRSADKRRKVTFIGPLTRCFGHPVIKARVAACERAESRFRPARVVGPRHRRERT